MPQSLNELWLATARALYEAGKAIADIAKSLIELFGMLADTALKYARVAAGWVETGELAEFTKWLRKSVQIIAPDGTPGFMSVRVPVFAGDTPAEIDARIEAARRALQARVDAGETDPRGRK